MAIRRFLPRLLIFLFLLTACAVPFSPLPSNVVMLTPLYPTVEGRCTGAVIDATHVLTAAHCTHTAHRVITPWGQEARVVSYSALPDQDVAVLETDKVLFVEHYAELARAELGVVGTVFGTCPYYWGHQARAALYNGIASINDDDYDQWIMQTNKACGGDSGGVVMQNGKVTGVISAVESDLWFVAIGTVMYAVPSGVAQELLNNEKAVAGQNQDQAGIDPVAAYSPCHHFC